MNKTTKQWICGIIATIVTLTVMLGGSYKPLVYRIFNDYEEECLEYGQYDSTVCSGYWDWDNYTKINGSWHRSNRTEPICRCGAIMYFDGCLRTISLPNESNCLKYHLVRVNT